MPPLQKPTQGSGGWNVPLESNIDALNSKLNNLIGDDDFATKTVGALTAKTSAQLTDSTTGTPGTTINDVGATFNQATLNDNFASSTDQINKLESEVLDIHTKLDLLIASLKITGGVGVLND